MELWGLCEPNISGSVFLLIQGGAAVIVLIGVHVVEVANVLVSICATTSVSVLI